MKRGQRTTTRTRGKSNQTGGSPLSLWNDDLYEELSKEWEKNLNSLAEAWDNVELPEWSLDDFPEWSLNSVEWELPEPPEWQLPDLADWTLPEVDEWQIPDLGDWEPLGV